MTAAARGLLAVGLLAGCKARPEPSVTLPPGTAAAGTRKDEPPVPLDPDPAVEYPAALANQRIGGTVLLRLFLDSTGRVAPDSSRIHESSGYPALDSAALKAAPRFRYAPGLRNGTPVAGGFLQPVQFRARS